MFSSPYRAYFLMPNIGCCPNTHLKLGQIVYDLKAPTQRLAEPVGLLPLIDESEEVTWRESQEHRIGDPGTGVFTQFLCTTFGIGQNELLMHCADALASTTLQTQSIKPNKEHAEQAMQNLNIQNHCVSNPDKAVYMVTGIKAAGNVDLRKIANEARRLSDLKAQSGFPVLRPRVSLLPGMEECSVFVFAYQVKLISLNHLENVHRGQIFKSFEVTGIGRNDFGLEDGDIDWFASTEVEDDEDHVPALVYHQVC